MSSDQAKLPTAETAINGVLILGDAASVRVLLEGVLFVC
jgi:hypothetical protein